MAMIAMAFPVLPGKTEAGLRFADEVSTTRRAEYHERAQRLGVRQEQWFLQNTPQGDLVLAVWECDDPVGELKEWANPTTDFERWFIQNVQDICGVDLREPPPEAAMPCSIMSYRA